MMERVSIYQGMNVYLIEYGSHISKCTLSSARLLMELQISMFVTDVGLSVKQHVALPWEFERNFSVVKPTMCFDTSSPQKTLKITRFSSNSHSQKLTNLFSECSNDETVQRTNFLLLGNRSDLIHNLMEFWSLQSIPRIRRNSDKLYHWCTITHKVIQY